MAKMYANENFPRQCVEALAQRIHSALEENPDMSDKLVRVNRPLE